MEELSLEKRFEHQTFKRQVERMSHEQAQEFCIRLHEMMLAKEQFYQGQLRKQFGLEFQQMREDG